MGPTSDLSVNKPKKKMVKKREKRSNTLKNSNNKFTKKTRLYDLVRKEQHGDLRLFIKVIRSWLINGGSVSWKTLNKLEIDNTKISNTKFLLVVANFLHRINCNNGLKCRMAVFIRYLASNEHTNFMQKEGTLKVMIYRALAYLRSKENHKYFGSNKNENINKFCYGKAVQFGSSPDPNYLCSQKKHKMNKAYKSIPIIVDDSKLEKTEAGCQAFSDIADEYPSGLRHISEVLTYYKKIIEDLRSYGNSCISKSF